MEIVRFDPVHVCCTDPEAPGSVGRSELAHRFEDYQQGRWAGLMRRGLGTVDEHCSKSHSTNESEQQQRGRAVLKRVQQGKVSRARQELMGAPLAPRDENTLNELRRRRPKEGCGTFQLTSLSSSLNGS